MMFEPILFILAVVSIILVFILQFYIFSKVKNQFKNVRVTYDALPRALRFTPMELYSAAFKTNEKKLHILAGMYVGCFILYVLLFFIFIAM